MKELHRSIKKCVCTRVEFKLQNEEYNSVTTLDTTSRSYSAHTWNSIFTNKWGSWKRQQLQRPEQDCRDLGSNKVLQFSPKTASCRKSPFPNNLLQTWQMTLGSTCEASQEHLKHHELWLYQNLVGQSEQSEWIKINFVNVNVVQSHTWWRTSVISINRSNLYKRKLTYLPSLLLLLRSTDHRNVRSWPD